VLVEHTILVRGRVRHADDDPVYLPAWSKVVRNTEPVADDGVAQMDGVRWVDSRRRPETPPDVRSRSRDGRCPRSFDRRLERAPAPAP
jgi:hypothetical protein